MNILVCVKQVPDTAEIKIDPVTNTMVRAGVPSILNPFDANAMEVAARIKDTDPNSKITVLSMGPQQATAALKECLAMGGDNAYLVSDSAFGGSDTLATSYVLSVAIRKAEEWEGKFDLLLFGKQAIDGDTAQVGPQIAEYLDYPQVTCGLEVTANQKCVTVKKEKENGTEVIGMDMPCVVTVANPGFPPRYPTIKSKLLANKANIPTLTAQSLPHINLARAGLKGSPTRVTKTFVPPRKQSGVKIEADTGTEAAKKLFEFLRNSHAI